MLGTRIPLTALQTALAVSGCPTPLEEVECLAVNLVARRLVKGYVSHERMVLVIAKEGAFPSVASVSGV